MFTCLWLDLSLHYFSAMKDNFSKQSPGYSKYRPSYPQELFEYLLSLVPNKNCAWDCGTGTGQFASGLANYFNEVYATDFSENQIEHAVKKNNIFYKVEKAEQTSFLDNQFDLITVAQAIHWFEFDKFYKEVKRTLKPGGMIAVTGYHLPRINKQIDEIVDDFYLNIVGKYWDNERKYIDEYYKTILFPFDEIKTPEFSSQYKWSLNHLIGYLNTWSAVQHYKDKNNNNPVDLINSRLKKFWKEDEMKLIDFPIILKAGK